LFEDIPFTIDYAAGQIHLFPARFQINYENGSHQMEKKQVTVGESVIVSGLTITPITKVFTYWWQDKERFSFFCLKQPLFVLISDRCSPIKIFTITGKAISQEQIISDYPDLKEGLEKLF
jgi:hypothetical protein